MIRRFVAAAALAGAVSIAVAGPALADNCYNASRPAPAGSQPAATGHWQYISDFGVWVFVPPDHYLNMPGEEKWLLENTPYCEAGGVLFYNGPRTTTNGIQSGCGFFG